ncbi:HD domain-containing protein [Candidatus Micrarchaeota archaeon]|nr:HD domain-containing protein [Candidatus Micrarchaeota archaeon]
MRNTVKTSEKNGISRNGIQLELFQVMKENHLQVPITSRLKAGADPQKGITKVIHIHRANRVRKLRGKNTEESRKIKNEIKEEKAKIHRAYNLAFQSHLLQFRDDGITPYVMHPLDVAYRITKSGFGTDDICAALLHDVIEDTKVTVGTIREKFGDGVAKKVNILTKPKLHKDQWVFADNPRYHRIDDEYKKLKKTNPQKAREIHDERCKVYYPRIFNSGDPGAMAIKIADNFSNIDSLKGVKKKKRIKAIETIAKWTFWIFPVVFGYEAYHHAANKFKKEGIDITGEMPIETLIPKHPIVVHQPRDKVITKMDKLRALGIPNYGWINVYGEIKLLFLRGWLEIGLPNDTNRQILEQFKTFLKGFRITTSESIFPSEVPAHEIILKVAGFTNGTTLKKLRENGIDMENIGEIKFEGHLEQEFKGTMNKYKLFLSRLTRFYERILAEEIKRRLREKTS